MSLFLIGFAVGVVSGAVCIVAAMVGAMLWFDYKGWED